MSINRLTGLASGMDTETMIKNLMKAERTRVDKVKQDKQYKVWEQEAMRSAITKLKSFQGGFFDVLKSDTNLRSQSFFSKFTSSVTAGGAASSAVQVTGGAGVTSLEHTISSITQLASKDTYTGEATGLRGITTGDVTGVGAGTMSISLSIDNVVKTVSITATAGELSAPGVDIASLLKSKFNTSISDAFGVSYSGVVDVDPSGDKLVFNKAGSTVKIFSDPSDTSDTLTTLGVSNGTSSDAYLTSTVTDLLSLSSEDDLKDMKINGVSLYDAGIRESTTLQDFAKKISDNTSMNVSLKLNTLNGSFTLTSDSEGSANSISTAGDLLTKLKLNGYTPASDAELKIDGTTITKSSNTFTIDGLTYTLKSKLAEADGPVDVKLSVDTTSITDKIKSFVSDYNDIIKEFNTKVTEKKYREYKPLTDEQKEAMSEDDIKKWEEKSKSGILRSSADLNQVLDRMRNALSTAVSDAGISLSEIGITTSSNYADRGKLVVDETKLKTALENKYDKVVSLFTSSSDYAYGDSANASARFSESGLGDRINDILNDYVKTFRGTSGKKGILIEKAGIEADTSIVNNTISKQLTEYDTRINKLLDMLTDKETRYYDQFGKMETAMNNMQSQSAWLSQQLGG